jgi:uncharacterized repeat protein (TIGR03803 family)
VYSFGAAPDGNYPDASLIDVGGTLYGTTVGGGSHTGYGSYVCAETGGRCGTVFSITPSGTEKVLHNFGKGTDGANPRASLIEAKGKLYGTTEFGGQHKCFFSTIRFSCGTVFSITTQGKEKVVYSFGGYAGDGIQPVASLIALKGKLYGTTVHGGGYSCTYGLGCGSVFSVTRSGAEKVLSRLGNGFWPVAALISVKGTFYGTTPDGGAGCYTSTSSYGPGCGTVFDVTTAGAESVAHSFRGSPDGSSPTAGLIDVKNTLYGTTAIGGAHNNGTVFSITPGGTEKVLYSFGGLPDGGEPTGTLIEVKGKLYGTTLYGGSGCRSYGCGTVYSISTSGTEKVLYRFGGSPDGAGPHASLVNVNGTLYGTTVRGGTFGMGTVFALTP